MGNGSVMEGSIMGRVFLPEADTFPLTVLDDTALSLHHGLGFVDIGDTRQLPATVLPSVDHMVVLDDPGASQEHFVAWLEHRTRVAVVDLMGAALVEGNLALQSQLIHGAVCQAFATETESPSKVAITTAETVTEHIGHWIRQVECADGATPPCAIIKSAGKLHHNLAADLLSELRLTKSEYGPLPLVFIESAPVVPETPLSILFPSDALPSVATYRMPSLSIDDVNCLWDEMKRVSEKEFTEDFNAKTVLLFTGGQLDLTLELLARALSNNLGLHVACEIMRINPPMITNSWVSQLREMLTAPTHAADEVAYRLNDFVIEREPSTPVSDIDRSIGSLIKTGWLSTRQGIVGIRSKTHARLARDILREISD